MSFNDSDELPDLALSAAGAAILMFEIGRTLEDADRFSDPASCQPSAHPHIHAERDRLPVCPARVARAERSACHWTALVR